MKIPCHARTFMWWKRYFLWARANNNAMLKLLVWRILTNFNDLLMGEGGVWRTYDVLLKFPVGRTKDQKTTWWHSGIVVLIFQNCSQAKFLIFQSSHVLGLSAIKCVWINILGAIGFNAPLFFHNFFVVSLNKLSNKQLCLPLIWDTMSFIWRTLK